MSDWEHTDRSSDGGCYWCDGETACATPIPDPTSPCGFDFGGHEEACGLTAEQHGEASDTHEPTLCTCGHAITEAPR